MDRSIARLTLAVIAIACSLAVICTAVDDALPMRAYLAQCDINRAYALTQGHDRVPATTFPVNDGHLAWASHVRAPDFAGACGAIAASLFHFYASARDDRAWAQLALARLQNRTNGAV